MIFQWRNLHARRLPTRGRCPWFAIGVIVGAVEIASGHLERMWAGSLEAGAWVIAARSRLARGAVAHGS